MTWETVIGGVALVFSVICFGLFLWIALARPSAEEIATKAANKATGPQESFDPRIIGQLATALSEAFNKAGPGLVALIGSILFLLLSGEAVNVYNLTGSASEQSDPATPDAGDQTDGNDSIGNDANGSADGPDTNATGDNQVNQAG